MGVDRVGTGICGFAFFFPLKAWDTETTQDTGVQVSNLACVRPSNSSEKYTFEGSNCIEDVLAWLRELSEDRKLVVIAHNSKGFDSYFI